MLVVAFASAPGVPNWGGLLERIRRAMQEPAHKCFDILYVVDAGRSWYSGADHLHSWQHMFTLFHPMRDVTDDLVHNSMHLASHVLITWAQMHMRSHGNAGCLLPWSFQTFEA